MSVDADIIAELRRAAELLEADPDRVDVVVALSTPTQGHDKTMHTHSTCGPRAGLFALLSETASGIAGASGAVKFLGPGGPTDALPPEAQSILRDAGVAMLLSAMATQSGVGVAQVLSSVVPLAIGIHERANRAQEEASNAVKH
jgi:hypothetical protein